MNASRSKRSVRSGLALSGIVLFLIVAPPASVEGGKLPAATAERQVNFLDAVWVWGIPVGLGAYEIAEGEMLATTDPAQFAQANAQGKAAILGVNNIFMSGSGLPRDLKQAEKLSREISHLKRVVWEVTPDSGMGPPFVYSDKLRVLVELRKGEPPLKAILLDDLLTSFREQGLRPPHVAKLRQEFNSLLPGVPMWGVVYTKNFDDPLLPQYLPLLDGITMWTWEPEEIRNLDRNFARTEEMADGKPILIGLYMYDYLNDGKMPRELMQLQCQKALALVKKGRAKGLIFLAVNNDPETIIWTRDWIREHAEEPIPAP